MLLAGGSKVNRRYEEWRNRPVVAFASSQVKQPVPSNIYSHTKLFQKETQSLSSSNGTSKPPETELADLALHWAIDYENRRIQLAVAVSEARGWVGLGFSEMGGMKGADMVIFEARGRKLYDAYSVAYEHPQTDPQQDWILVDSVVEDGLIIFEAERDLDTNDNMDRVFAEGDENVLHVIGAWGDSDEMHHHGPDNRVKGNVFFFYNKPKEEKVGNDSSVQHRNNTRGEGTNDFEKFVLNEKEGTVSLHMDNFVVPHQRQTTYKWKCVTTKNLVRDQGLPGNTPLHLLGLEFDLDPGHLVHHIVLYQSTNEDISRCDPWKGPNSAVYIWNKGQARKFHFPENVGMLLADQSARAGSSLGIPPKSFRLEIHYENPNRLKGVRDRSGFRLHYTSNLRQFTAGTMELGDPLVKLMGAPVGDGLYQHDFSCPSSCTKLHLPQQGVTIFNTLLHMHNNGLTMEIVHGRDGKELHVSRVEYFDFAFGGYIDEQQYEILPGDTLQARCTYDGDDTLKFGISAREEMCLGKIFYYPASLSANIMGTVKSDVKGCAADHTMKKLAGMEALNRTFGVLGNGVHSFGLKMEQQENLVHSGQAHSSFKSTLKVGFASSKTLVTRSMPMFLLVLITVFFWCRRMKLLRLQSSSTVLYKVVQQRECGDDNREK